MKTEKKFRSQATLNIIMVLSLIVLVITFSSCGKSKESDVTSATVAPPPPPVPASEPVYTEVDEMPQFAGGDTGLLEFVKVNTVYPDEAKKKNITGRVIVKFVVLKDGSVSKVEIAKGVNPLLDAEAVRVVSLLPKFEKPGKKGGEPVSVAFAIPISFALN